MKERRDKRLVNAKGKTSPVHSSGLQFLESPGKLSLNASSELRRIRADQFFVGRHDNVVVERTQQGTQETKILSDLALGSVSIERCAPGLERDAETKVVQPIGNAKDRALSQSDHVVFGKETPVLPRIVESMRISKRTRRIGNHGRPKPHGTVGSTTGLGRLICPRPSR